MKHDLKSRIVAINEVDIDDLCQIDITMICFDEHDNALRLNLLSDAAPPNRISIDRATFHKIP